MSPEDFAALSESKWSARWNPSTKSFYAYRQVWVDGRAIAISMHQVIMNPPDGMLVDHRYRDTLDNRRSELRIATHSQNRGNSKRREDCSSGYKGVKVSPNGKKWTASITYEGTFMHLGTFDTPEEAHEAYVHAAENLLEEFARAA